MQSRLHSKFDFFTYLGSRTYLTGSLCLGVLAVLIVQAWTFWETRSLAPQPPFEDAAMLFRYVEVAARGGGISWNDGMAPGVTDGATDLGFVLILTPLVWLGLSVEVAALSLNLMAVFAIGYLLGWLSLRIVGLNFVLAASLVTLVASGPLNRYITSGFSPAILAALLLLLTLFAHSLLREPNSRSYAWLLLGLISGISGWWRPEGFALAPITIAAVIATQLSVRSIGRFLRSTSFLLLIAGYACTFLSWIFFRLIYFGHLLPASAVMKGGINPANALETLEFFTYWLLPFLSIVAALALRRPSRTWVLILSMLACSLVWVPVTFHLNWWNRFQWPLLPTLAAVGLLSIGFLHQPRPANLRATRIWLHVSALFIIIGTLRALEPVGYGYAISQPHHAIAASLESIDTSTVRLATTEAGLIPLAISGVALDTAGFNNYSIALSGGESLADELDAFAPNLLVANGPPPSQYLSTMIDPSCTLRDPLPYLGATWLEMHETLMNYVESQEFVLLTSTETGACQALSVYAAPDLDAAVNRALLAVRSGNNELVVSS